MNAQNAPQNPKKALFTITLKATYQSGYNGPDSTRTVTDTASTPFERDLEHLALNSFRDIVERMSYSRLFSEEDEYTASAVPRMQKKAQKRVLDAIWDSMHDGFSAKVSFSFNDGFDPYESEISGIPTTLEISVSRKEDEDPDGGKKEQRLDVLSASDVLETMDKIVQTLKFVTHCAKSNDDISRSDMFDYIDDLKTGLKTGFNSGLKNETKSI